MKALYILIVLLSKLINWHILNVPMFTVHRLQQVNINLYWWIKTTVFKYTSYVPQGLCLLQRIQINSIAAGKVIESDVAKHHTFCLPLEVNLQQVININQHVLIYSYHINLKFNILRCSLKTLSVMPSSIRKSFPFKICPLPL